MDARWLSVRQHDEQSVGLDETTRRSMGAELPPGTCSPRPLRTDSSEVLSCGPPHVRDRFMDARRKGRSVEAQRIRRVNPGRCPNQNRTGKVSTDHDLALLYRPPARFPASPVMIHIHEGPEVQAAGAPAYLGGAPTPERACVAMGTKRSLHWVSEGFGRLDDE